MYDEVMQLIALAKNDEQYFKRIEDLKQKQLELAHVLEIAETLKEADMHLANARQQATEIIVEATKEAELIKETSNSIVVESKALLEKNKAKAVSLKEQETNLRKAEQDLKKLETELTDSITEHRKLTADRTIEQQAAQKVRVEFETKLKKLREIAAT